MKTQNEWQNKQSSKDKQVSREKQRNSTSASDRQRSQQELFGASWMICFYGIAMSAHAGTCLTWSTEMILISSNSQRSQRRTCEYHIGDQGSPASYEQSHRSVDKQNTWPNRDEWKTSEQERNEEKKKQIDTENMPNMCESGNQNRQNWNEQTAYKTIHMSIWLIFFRFCCCWFVSISKKSTAIWRDNAVGKYKRRHTPHKHMW